jgi:hypothetical protein
VGGARQEATLLDISCHGCLVNGATSPPAGTRLRVAVGAWGVAATFRVCAASARGLHMQLEAGSGAEGWTDHVERMTGGAKETPSKAA